MFRFFASIPPNPDIVSALFFGDEIMVAINQDYASSRSAVHPHRRSNSRMPKTPYPRSIYVRTGLRFYSPNLHTWLSRYPMGERGGLNLYVIVNNGCVYITDPLGFTVWDYGDGALQFVGSVFIVSAGVAVIAGGALIVAPAAAVAASAAGGALILWGALKASDAGSALGAATVGYSAPDPLYVQTVQWAIETTTGSELSPQGKKYVRISYYSLDAVAACSTISISAFSTVEKLQKASVQGIRVRH